MRKLLFGILTSLVMMGSAYAFNLSFLDDSAAYYFTPADWTLAQSTAMKALDKNVKLSWKNPDTGASGYVVPFNTTRQNGTICRYLKIYSEAHKVTGVSTYQFCRINGEWKIPG